MTLELDRRPIAKKLERRMAVSTIKSVKLNDREKSHQIGENGK